MIVCQSTNKIISQVRITFRTRKKHHTKRSSGANPSFKKKKKPVKIDQQTSDTRFGMEAGNERCDPIQNFQPKRHSFYWTVHSWSWRCIVNSNERCDFCSLCSILLAQTYADWLKKFDFLHRHGRKFINTESIHALMADVWKQVLLMEPICLSSCIITFKRMRGTILLEVLSLLDKLTKRFCDQHDRFLNWTSVRHLCKLIFNRECMCIHTCEGRVSAFQFRACNHLNHLFMVYLDVSENLNEINVKSSNREKKTPTFNVRDLD